MMSTFKKALFLACILFITNTYMHARVTSLQRHDPLPLYNAANLGCPVDAHLSSVQHAHMKDMYEEPERFCVSLSISPFYQKAVRASDGTTTTVRTPATTGQNATPATATEYTNYYGDAPSSDTPVGALGDLQGTTYLMGLFLGPDPISGNSMWLEAFEDGAHQISDLTTQINNTQFPDAINDAANAIASLFYYNNGLLTPGANNPGQNNPPIYLENTSEEIAKTQTSVDPNSILNPTTLAQDKKYFGALSVPFTYERLGARFECNFEITPFFGLYARTGFSQIKNIIHNNGIKDLSTDSQATITIPNATTPIYKASLYNGLYTSNGVNMTPEYTGQTAPNNSTFTVGADPFATTAFDNNVTNNLTDLFSATRGIDYRIENWTRKGLEDVEVGVFLRKTFLLHPRASKRHLFENIILTPYATFAATLATAELKDYRQALSFASGNNGHNSMGGEVGLTIDFNSTIEVGGKIGFTHFFAEDFYQRPCPTHELQRVIYPFKTDLHVEPGYNWNMGICMNAYHFLETVSFYASYDRVEHTKDTTTLLKTNQYFKPEMLDELSSWSSQMITLALDFELHDQIHFALAWQGPIKQENAYATHTFMGSLGFMF